MKKIFRWSIWVILLISCIDLFGQAPERIGGRTIQLTISSGQAPFASSGVFRFLPAANDGKYAIVPVSGTIVASFGQHTYTKTGADTAGLTAVDSVVGQLAVNCAFNSANTGNFVITSTSIPGRSQTGTFVIFSGNSPSSPIGYTFNINVTSGKSPFASIGIFKFLPNDSDNSYSITGISGISNSSGTYTYTRDSETTGVIDFVDSIVGAGISSQLSFESATTGTIFLRQSGGSGYQTGIFSMEAFAPPDVSIPPQTQAVTVGAAVTFTVAATGTGPLSYQWRKEGTNISGANQAVYSIAKVQLADAGVYDVVVSNAAGSRASQVATLTVASSPSSDLWVKKAGGSGNDFGYGVTVDLLGNSYVVGDFEGSAQFGNTNLTSRGTSDMFFAKYGPDGTVLWVRQFGGEIGGHAAAVASDASGNSYITGFFQGSAFDGRITSTGGDDVFLASFDPNGELRWVRQAGGASGYETGIGVGIGENGEVVIAGTFGGVGETKFGEFSLVSNGQDIFVAKYDNLGNLIWVRGAGGSGEDYGTAATVDALGNVYVTGYFHGPSDFGLTRITGHGGRDVFLAKYSPVGTLLWVKDAGGTGDELGRGISVDASGNAWISGDFSGTASFGGITLTASGQSDLFLAKYDKDGIAVWASRAGGSGSVIGFGLSVDVLGNAFVTGSFTGTVDFGNAKFSSLGGSDAYVAAFNTAGTIRWSRQFGGAGSDRAVSIAADAANNLHLAGDFSGMLDTSSGALASAGGQDAFLAKLSTVGPPLKIRRFDNNLVLTWSALAVGFVLESSGQLRPPFSTESIPPVQAVSQNELSISVPTAGLKMFYQLNKN